MRGALFCVIAAAALGGCSLLVSLDDLQNGSTSDAGLADASTNDAIADATPLQEASTDASTSAYAALVLSDSPIAYYRLGDTGTTAVDSTSHHFDGTYTDVVTHAQGLLANDDDPSALFGGALDGGAFARISIPRNAAFETKAAITIEAWARPLDVDGEIASYGAQTNNPFQPWVLQEVGGAPAKIAFYAANVGYFVSPNPLTLGTTYYLVATYDGANAIVYVNAVVALTTNAPGLLNNYDGVLGLAIGSGTLGEHPYTGEIDEVAIYDHVLGPDRITAHYAAGTK